MKIAKIVGIVCIVLLSIALPLSGNAQDQSGESGLVFGQIVNRTTGEPVPEIAVTLSTFAGGTLQANQNAVTDDDGRFEFPVDSDPEIVYAVSTSFFGISYSTGRISFEEDSVGIDVTLDVFEPTDDQSLARIRSRGLILTDVEPVRGELGLLDIYVLDMSEERVLVANDEGRAVTFPVPRNATRVTPLPDTTYNLQTATIEGATVYGTEPLMPGEMTATLSYTIPYTEDRLRIELQNAYTTDLFRILVPLTVTDQSEKISLEASGFTYSGEEQIGPQTYDVWTREDVPATDRMQVTYTGLQRSQIEPNTLNKIAPAAVASVAGVAAIGVAFFLVRGRKLYGERPVVLAPRLASSLETQRADLIEQLQALEDAHESQIVDESEYREYRQLILEQIRIVNRQLRGEGVED